MYCTMKKSFQINSRNVQRYEVVDGTIAPFFLHTLLRCPIMFPFSVLLGALPSSIPSFLYFYLFIPAVLSLDPMKPYMAKRYLLNKKF